MSTRAVAGLSVLLALVVLLVLVKVTRAAPPPAPPPVVAVPQPVEAPAPKTCSPPYYYTHDGVKHYKPQCLDK